MRHLSFYRHIHAYKCKIFPQQLFWESLNVRCLLGSFYFKTHHLFYTNHTNIFRIKPKGLQKCREIKTISIYDAEVRKDFRFQYINKKIVSLSKALTIRKEWLVKEMFSSINQTEIDQKFDCEPKQTIIVREKSFSEADLQAAIIVISH